MSDEVHFRQFAGVLEAAIARYDITQEESLIERQRRQLMELLSLEKAFRKALVSHHLGNKTYKKFLHHILEVRHNILAARPYFRERQEEFAEKISDALKKKNEKTLYKFRINSEFVTFVMRSHAWPKRSKITKLANKILQMRNEIIEMNMPLAISQARIFWSNTPRSHLSFMDLVQIHAAGLLTAVDKFVPPDTSEMTEQEELDAYRKFRAVAIGRMIGDRIEQYSETLVHFYPNDKRKIYRANKALRVATPGESTDWDKIADIVNKEVEPNQKTNSLEIAELVSGASCVSGDVPLLSADGGPEETTLERFAADEETRPDVRIEELDAMMHMQAAFRQLDLVAKKTLMMKGVNR